jgi:hypothetical protein
MQALWVRRKTILPPLGLERRVLLQTALLLPVRALSVLHCDRK